MNFGPIYMFEALAVNSSNNGYNYGFDNTDQGWTDGTGGEAALAAANSNYGTFNREQQAMIVQHYYTRRYVENLPEAQYQAWMPYAQQVFTS